MAYFTKEYLNFFKTLAANNHKQWFDLNRKTYETVVREPFKVFIGDVIQAIQKIDSEVAIQPKDAIFRINRDVRFSKDKTPYKLFNSAIISKTGRKDKSYPGMYIELNPERLAIYGGVYMPNKVQIEKMRNYIIQNNKKLETILNTKAFKESYGEILGDKYKRLPKEIQEKAEKQPLLYNKQWYYQCELKPKTILQKDLLDVILQYYKIGHPLQEFLTKALT